MNKFLPEPLKLISNVDKVQEGIKREVISERSNEEDSSEDERRLSPRVLVRTRDDGEFFVTRDGKR